jgi:glycosyltransferase involved in cell wall biosynthesis
VVVAHPDDEVLWLAAVLPYATKVLAAFSVAGGDSALTRGRELVRTHYPFSGFEFLGLQNADVYGQSDFLSRAPVDHGVSLMRSCPPVRAERYRSNYPALLAAVDPYVGPQTDIYTHNPWGEYGHEEHVQVNHAVVALARRHGCSVWAWDGLSSEKLISNDVWLRADYYPDDALGDVPRRELAVDLESYKEIRALYQRNGAWTWHDDYLPPNPSRFLQLVRGGDALVSPRHLPRSRRALIAGQVISRKTQYYARGGGKRIRSHAPRAPRVMLDGLPVADRPAPAGKQPMRILMYAKSLKREGGTEISSVQIARALSQRGHSLDLLYEYDGELHSEYLSFCRSVTRSWMTVDKRSVRDAARLVPAIWSGARRRPDVIYVHRFRDVICARLTGLLARAPVVCHLRDMFHDGTTRRLAKWADRFIAISGATRDSWVNDGLDGTRVDVVHQGVDPIRYSAGGRIESLQARETLGLPAHVFVALYYGRLDVDKGIDLLLDAWRRLGMSDDKGRLVLQGRPVLARDPDAYLQDLKERAPEGCHWLPMRDDVITVLHAADVVVLPSVIEGLGRVVLEGMASGRPVVASRVGGIPEILTGPFERFLFESGDAADLANRLASVVDWQQREPQLGVDCSEHIRAHFNLQRMAASVEDILRREVDSRSKVGLAVR